MKAAVKIALLGGGEEELNILSELHRDQDYEIIGIYDRDPRAVAIEIAEIIGVPVYTDLDFIEAFRKADHVIVTNRRKQFQDEIDLLLREDVRIMNPSEAATMAVPGDGADGDDKVPWPRHLDEALNYINRITDRERLLKWLLEISVRTVRASSGSIMLFSERTGELYIGYAAGLSLEVTRGTRQKLGTGIAGHVAESRTAALVSDRIRSPLYEKGREREDIQSAVSAPLIHEDMLLGVLNVSTDRGERELGRRDLETIDLLASKISPILHQHMRIDGKKVRESEYEIRNAIEKIFRTDEDFHGRFDMLARALSEILEADTVTIYTATDEGDWLILGGSDQQVHETGSAPRIHCLGGCLARSFIQGEEVLLTEARHEAGLELAGREDSITSIYIPIVHEDPIGVAALEFSDLDSFERFMKLKDVLRFQLGFFVQSQLRELRQERRLRSLEDLSSLTPFLMSAGSHEARIKNMPVVLSRIVGASAGSFHLVYEDFSEAEYHGFPAGGEDRERRIAFDERMLETAMEKGRAECTSYMRADTGTYDRTPVYRSVIVFPMRLPGKGTGVYIGYDRVPASPLDPSIFGTHDLELLEKAARIVVPMISGEKSERPEPERLSFDELLKTNRELLLSRMDEEIERSQRYHHGFIVTIFRVKGLKELIRKDYQAALELINELSRGVRSQVRKTDYFSWIETDLFAILSLESYGRIEHLERRLMEFITRALEERRLYHVEDFHPVKAFAVFPGKSDTARQLVDEARKKVRDPL